MQKHDEVKEELIQTDTEFRRLYQEHQDHERRLDQMAEPTPPRPTTRPSSKPSRSRSFASRTAWRR